MVKEPENPLDLAKAAIDLLLSVGCWGLHPERKDELWQEGLELNAVWEKMADVPENRRTSTRFLRENPGGVKEWRQKEDARALKRMTEGE